jgi:hypothetical protein
MADEPSGNKTQHLHLLMSPSEVEAIDNWGFKNRIRTRAEAIRRLCQIALSAENNLDMAQDLISSSRHWMFSAIEAYERETGNEISDPMAKDAPAVAQNAYIGAMIAGLGLTFLGKTTQDQDALRTIGDFKKALDHLSVLGPGWNIELEVNDNFLERLQKLNAHKSEPI